jgi:hypothetical protein
MCMHFIKVHRPLTCGLFFVQLMRDTRAVGRQTLFGSLIGASVGACVGIGTLNITLLDKNKVNGHSCLFIFFSSYFLLMPAGIF